MTAEDLEVASRFRVALETAVRTGDHSELLQLVAPDIEWITPQRTLQGVDQLRDWPVWGGPGETLDIEFEDRGWVDEGDGHVTCDVKQIYRVKPTGDLAYKKIRRIELTVQDRMISRYQLRFTG